MVCRYFGKSFSKQSDRNVCRTYFPNGYLPKSSSNSSPGTSTGKKCAKELPGVLLCLLMYLLCDADKEYLEKYMGTAGRQEWIQIINHLLLLD